MPVNWNVSAIPAEEATSLRELYRATLFDEFVPWWESHSIDREYGGFYSCLERDGKPYAGDKFVWMLGRQTWMFGLLYNVCEQRGEWLEIAGHGARFLLDHAFSEGGRMYFRLSRDGRPLARHLSPESECFTIMALAELGRARGDSALWQRAVEMYRRARPLLGQPTDTPLLGYPLHVQFHLYAHDMLRLTVAWVLNRLEPAPEWEDDLAESARSVIERHWKPEHAALLENVAPDGTPMLDVLEGRLLNPGHALETAWMLMEVARERKDTVLLETAVKIVLCSMERAWDDAYGGLRYLANLDGTPMRPFAADMKLWWPHAEALYALLSGWALTGRDEIRAWYRKVHDYAFAHFPDRQYGEWYGYLNRDGSPTFTAKADGFKGFFHLPRVFLRCHQLLGGAQAADGRVPRREDA